MLVMQSEASLCHKHSSQILEHALVAQESPSDVLYLTRHSWSAYLIRLSSRLSKPLLPGAESSIMMTHHVLHMASNSV